MLYANQKNDEVKAFYEDVLERKPIVFDPENLITTTHNTHNAIHYGDESLLITVPVERSRNDTCPWRH